MIAAAHIPSPHPPDVRVLRSHRAVRIPGRGDTALAPARLVVRRFRVDLRPVGLLQLPADQPVLDEDFPGARTRAVDAVAGPHRPVVGPPLAGEVLPVPR